MEVNDERELQRSKADDASYYARMSCHRGIYKGPEGSQAYKDFYLNKFGSNFLNPLIVRVNCS